ncbi:hypothetical protein GIB67_028820 [Kingdonia uniflora]|uniref:Cytochrome P450 n=1 Tax=Kingdonia uniflora TaxID=39325 RepID=A0A7J7LT39_9MAGN|nr:hypothetical protein GIB67_028820 [Kingdonia uniflora]
MDLLFLQEIRTQELLLGLLILVIIYYMFQQKQHCLPFWPIIGMLPSLLLGLSSGLHEWFTTVLKNQNGTFRLKGPWLSSLDWVVTSNPVNIEHVLKTNFSNFPKGEHYREIMSDLFGEGLFNLDGDEWVKQRKAVSIEFHSQKFRTGTTESIFHLVHNFLLPVLEDSIKACNIVSVPIDIQDIFLRFAFDNICMIGFGFSLESLKIGLPDIPFVKAFDDATDASLLRLFSPVFLWKLMRFLNLGWEKTLMRSVREIDETTEEYMQVQLESLKSEDKKFVSGIPTTFIAMKNDEGNPYTDKFLRDNCMGLILAGKDPSAATLAWFFWLLDQHPEVEKNILAEIRGILGEREDRYDPVFGPDDIKKMEYLHAALSESLRLYPPAAHEMREVAEDDVFPDGTQLRKGTSVFYSIYAMGRTESIWGKDCQEYKPERWLKDGKFVSESSYKFPVFNGGPRVCLGKEFAYYQMKYVSASIIYRYRVKVVEDHPVVPKLAFSMTMKYGLKIVLSKR